MQICVEGKPGNKLKIWYMYISYNFIMQCCSASQLCYSNLLRYRNSNIIIKMTNVNKTYALYDSDDLATIGLKSTKLATIPLTRRMLVPRARVCRVGGANSFSNFCSHAQLNHSSTALVAKVSCDQSHSSAWGTSATHYMLYALKELWLLTLHHGTRHAMPGI